MMPQTELLAYYESIAAATSAMLSAARASRWNDLIAAERECAVRIARLRALPTVPELDERGCKHKFDLIHTVLEDDAEIRRLMQPWLQRLDAFLCRAAAGRKVSTAYG